MIDKGTKEADRGEKKERLTDKIDIPRKDRYGVGSRMTKCDKRGSY